MTPGNGEESHLDSLTQVFEALIFDDVRQHVGRMSQNLQEFRVQCRLFFEQRRERRPADLKGNYGAIKSLGIRIVRLAKIKRIITGQFARSKDSYRSLPAVSRQQENSDVPGLNVIQPVGRFLLPE